MPAQSFVTSAPDWRGLASLSETPNFSAIMAQIEATCREAKARASARRLGRRADELANLNEE